MKDSGEIWLTDINQWMSFTQSTNGNEDRFYFLGWQSQAAKQPIRRLIILTTIQNIVHSCIPSYAQIAHDAIILISSYFSNRIMS